MKLAPVACVSERGVQSMVLGPLLAEQVPSAEAVEQGSVASQMDLVPHCECLLCGDRGQSWRLSYLRAIHQ